MAPAKHVAVVGGGFVGLSCALQILRAGHKVTLLDRAAVGSPQHSASYGNAGTFAAYANVPVNKPGIAWDLPRMLTSPTSPLAIKPTPHLLKMIPWFAHFLRNCRPQAVEQTSMALGTLLMRAEAGYDAVWEQAGVDINGRMGEFAGGVGSSELPYSCREGYLILQRTQEAMQGSKGAAELRRRGLGSGLRMEALLQDEVLALEPQLAPGAAGGGAWWFPDGWFLRDPGALLRALSHGFVESGGELRTGRDGAVKSLAQSRDGGISVQLAADPRDDAVPGRRLEADEVVVAAGAHSAALAASMGDWCPLDTERGHHVAWRAGSELLFRRAICDPAQGFIMTPMAHGLRAAGTVELGGTASGLTAARCDQLEAATARLLRPEVSASLGPRQRESDWLGFRPTMPDALPVLGRSSRVPKVIYAFGHQHIGWTLGGITGQIVAELVAEKHPCVDLRPFHPDRFRLW